MTLSPPQKLSQIKRLYLCVLIRWILFETFVLFFPGMIEKYEITVFSYLKPTTNLSQVSQIVDGGRCDVEWNYEALIPCFACTDSTSCLSGFNEYIQKARFNY